jgi:hypothetical protein
MQRLDVISSCLYGFDVSKHSLLAQIQYVFLLSNEWLFQYVTRGGREEDEIPNLYTSEAPIPRPGHHDVSFFFFYFFKQPYNFPLKLGVLDFLFYFEYKKLPKIFCLFSLYFSVPHAVLLSFSVLGDPNRTCRRKIYEDEHKSSPS